MTPSNSDKNSVTLTPSSMGEGKLGGSPSSPDAGGRSQGHREQADVQPPPSSSKGTAGSDSADACASTSEGDEPAITTISLSYQSIVITITITISSTLPTIMIIVVIIIIHIHITTIINSLSSLLFHRHHERVVA